MDRLVRNNNQALLRIVLLYDSGIFIIVTILKQDNLYLFDLFYLKKALVTIFLVLIPELRYCFG